MLQACLNGIRPPHAHPGLPVWPYQLAHDARAVAGLGAESVHVHPRGGRGQETIDTGPVGDVVAAIRSAAPGIEVVVPAARWVAPDLDQRADAVRGWGRLPPPARPDVVALSVGEHGWQQVCAASRAGGMGLELGIWNPADAVALRRAGLPPGVVRLVAEVTIGDPALALTEADRLLRALDPLHIPILLHGEDDDAWPVWAYATRRGLHTRIGLEDTLTTPDGSTARGNPDLVAHALRGQGHDRALDYGLTRRASHVFDPGRAPPSAMNLERLEPSHVVDLPIPPPGRNTPGEYQPHRCHRRSRIHRIASVPGTARSR